VLALSNAIQRTTHVHCPSSVQQRRPRIKPWRRFGIASVIPFVLSHHPVVFPNP
jgi:hypothetical protein